MPAVDPGVERLIEITFEIDGRRVDPNKVGDALEAAVFKSIKRQIGAKIGSIRDPVTGEGPKITAKGRNLESLTFEVHGSEELIRKVRQRLA